MAHAATVTMDMSGDVARGVAGALEVEAAAGLPRVSAVVRRMGGDGCGCRGEGDGGVTIGLTADDASSLRAALNSFLRWADLAASVSRGASVPVDARAEAKGKASKQSKGRRGAARPSKRPRHSASARPRSGSSPRRGKKPKR
jgi:tRNA threonylcarbamoyladenosine modification (KEOPS) complex  Pcc1 subunit